MGYTSDVCTLVGWSESVPIYDWDKAYPCHLYFIYPLPPNNNHQQIVPREKYTGCGVGDFPVSRENLPEGFVPKIGMKFTHSRYGGFFQIEVVSDQ